MKQVNLGFYRMVLFLLLGLFTSVIAYSQQISVKGIVKDQIGEPVIGANVLVRGTTNGVITNVNGEFILSASKSDVLVVSFVGYTTQEIPVSEKQMTIVLKEDTELLDEVVVLGYGANTRKQDLSASVGIISNTDELAARPVTSTESMLQGQLPGVTIQYNPQIQISAESETKRSIFREKDKTKRSKKESAQHSKSRNKSFVMTSVSAL